MSRKFKALEHQVEEDLAWRELELLKLKLLYRNATDEITKTSLLRTMQVLLYAHYEGYCKFIMQIWVEHINRIERRMHLSSGIWGTDFKKWIEKILRDKMPNEIIGEFRNIKNFLRSSPTLVSPLSDCDNLWPKKLKESLLTFDLNLPEIDSYEREIYNLVFRRNNIAHGQKLIISKYEDYCALEDKIFEIMIAFSLMLINALKFSK